MKTISRSIIILLFPLFSLAQGNYKQGFVITLKGDTIHGFIDLKEWGNNPRSVNFRPSMDKPIVSYTVADIDHFEVSKIVAYQRANTSVSLDETNTQRIGHERDTSSKMDNIFLKIEQRGNNVTLYTYQDDIKKRLYIYDRKTAKLAELTYRIYFVANDKINVSTVSQDAWKQQLLFIAQRYDTYKESIKTQIEDAEYNEAYIAPICRKINAANQEVNTSNLPHLRFFIGIGASFNAISPKGDLPIYNAHSYNSFAPNISAGFNFYPKPDVERSVIKVEFLYSSASYKTDGTVYIFDPKSITHYYYDSHTISFIPQFQYGVYNTDAFKFYLSLGVSTNYSKYSGNTFTGTDGTKTEDYLGLNSLWMSLPFKAGIILKKDLDLSVAYSYPMSVSDNHAGNRQNYNYSINMRSVRFTLGYIFK